MKIVQLQRKANENWKYLSEKISLKNPLVLIFGCRFLLESPTIFLEVKNLFPDGELIFGSTSGNIANATVTDQNIVITAIEFERSHYKIKTTSINSKNSNNALIGEALINQLPKKGLKYVFIVSDGSFVNGSELTAGMNTATKHKTLITGGLCGDGDRFKKTLASYNQSPKQGTIIAIGFYGETFEATSAINGGWTPFGPERTVTKSKGNILFELDHKPALDLYKMYLGDKAKQLPGAALLYPLNVISSKEQQAFVRTILNINENENAMVLAGDIPEGAKVQLMMTHVDNIVNASENAANLALKSRKSNAELAILVSCIGRKLVLDQRIEEEVEEIIEVVGKQTKICGFYSYGEIAPFQNETNCQLHNQTMTVTLLSE